MVTNIAKKKGSLANVLTPDMMKMYASKGMDFNEIGAMFGYSKTRICQIMEDDPNLKSAWEQGNSILADTLTSALMRLIDCEKPNVIAVLFALKSRCGWVEEQHRKDKEVTNQTTVSVYLPDNQRDPVQTDD
jgi:hypothetical protein